MEFLDVCLRLCRSESRNDILDSDHSLYDHSAPLYYQPAQYTGFVRTCDGKFIRNVGLKDYCVAKLCRCQNVSAEFSAKIQAANIGRQNLGAKFGTKLIW